GEDLAVGDPWRVARRGDQQLRSELRRRIPDRRPVQTGDRIDLHLDHVTAPAGLEVYLVDAVVRRRDRIARGGGCRARALLVGDVLQDLPHAELQLGCRRRVHELPAAVDRGVPQVVDAGAVRMRDIRDSVLVYYRW